MKLYINGAIKCIMICFTYLVTLTLYSCKKYLDEKPNSSITTINSIKDAQALLDDPSITSSYVSLATGASDEYYFSNAVFNSKQNIVKEAYLWDSDAQLNAWSLPYKVVFQSNVIIDALSKISGSQLQKDNILGQALFHRAFAFYHVAQLYCPAFGEQNMNKLGIALRLTSAVEEKTFRSTVLETYNRILKDLLDAVEVLPEDNDEINRPNKESTLGMLSRVYLEMGDYNNALKYSNEFLNRHSGLIDYNELDTTLIPGIPLHNSEVSFYAYMDGDIPGFETSVDSTLYSLYDSNDLRRSVFYYDPGDGSRSFKGSYSGVFPHLTFCGIASDEIYLNRAEANARLGNLDKALDDLNYLLVNRFKSGMHEPIVLSDQNEILDLILKERRKELVYRGIRWSDLRRLNVENRGIALRRMIDGTSYLLAPSDLRWTWLIPNEVLKLTNYPQNQR